MRQNQPDDVEALLLLFDETVALFHRLNIEAERIHEKGSLSAALRGILRGLQKHGPQTVPGMARMRPVSRQYVQELVNQLNNAGLIEFMQNPAHKRSQLVTLTPQGVREIDRMAQRETRLLSGLDTNLSLRDVERATETMKQVRTALEGAKWQTQLKKK